MPNKSKHKPRKPKRGKKMFTGKGWVLTGPNGRFFKGTLIVKGKVAGKTVILMSVLERPKKK